MVVKDGSLSRKRNRFMLLPHVSLFKVDVHDSNCDKLRRFDARFANESKVICFKNIVLDIEYEKFEIQKYQNLRLLVWYSL